MNNKSLIIFPNELPADRAAILYEEFKYAWDRTSNIEKKEWAKESLKILGKVTFRRGVGFIKAMGALAIGIGKEAVDLGVAVYNNEGVSHLNDRKERTLKFVKSTALKSKDILKNIINLLKTNPKETAPVIFLGVLGFFCGSGGLDGNGGVPDLDLAGGIGNHRSIFFHSIISAAVLETLVFSSVNAINIFHSKLPEKHDPFWDKIVSKNDWAKAFVTGACTGIAYHLLIDGTIQGGKALSDFPIKGMPMEFHNLFYITNAVAEGLDVNKKKY